MFYFRTITVYPRLPASIARLRELAYNFWFSWNPQAQSLFRDIDREMWENTNHNPVKMLTNVDPARLSQLSVLDSYLERYNAVCAAFDRYLTEETWTRRHFPQHEEHTVAYFSAEFGLHEAQPFYSGGLGLLAGDHLKAASDAGLPLVGVSLLYRQGYFTQLIDQQGWQKAMYPYQNFHELPLQPVYSPEGGQLSVNIQIEDENVTLLIWHVQIGRNSLYLLDADNSANSRETRRLTHQLYGGDHEMRFDQELVLGIGGVRALRAVGIKPQVWHLNEGHASFSLVERLRELVHQGVEPRTAIEYIRAASLFTTHTPVPAGHDIFTPEIMDRHFGAVYSQFGLSRDEFLALGWDETRQGFNMTVLAMRLCANINGVSRLHGLVTRRMFNFLYPDIPTEEIPVISITNGVHTPTWMAGEVAALLDKYLAKDWARHIYDKTVWEGVRSIPGRELWDVHQKLKERMIRFARKRLAAQYRRNHEPAELIGDTAHFLEPRALTIGFARRFATYKRALLIFSDLDRLDRLVNNPEHPVQLIFAGKAHPADRAGQEIIKFVCDQARSPRFWGRILFLEDYDINLARSLLQGVDVWLNTPRRPLEASGTSGQKAAINGVLNLSVLDGWWPEAYDGENGFAIGREDYPDDDTQDREDSHDLFNILEEVVVPLYYRLDNAWAEKMKSSLASIPPVFSADRMVKTYATHFYFPAVERATRLAGDGFGPASRLQRFKAFMTGNWSTVAIGRVVTDDAGEMPVGQGINVQAVVRLGKIDYRDVVVELVLGTGTDGDLAGLSLTPMTMAERIDPETYLYRGGLLPGQGTCGYSLRVRPTSPDFAYRFELPLAAWAPAF
ncbi:MAG: alpha-glucan family phosphorylase [Peptococcaceae bacterium]|jgi:starch phosphorylase|nr:alpha-glucan family phosphorylase [Peptococcaceae bacterium]